MGSGDGFGVFHYLFKFVTVCRYVIPVFWFITSCLGGWQAINLFNNLADKMDPSHTSPSAIAQRAFEDSQLCYPDFTVMMVHARDGSDITTDPVISGFFNASNSLSYDTLSYFEAAYQGYPIAQHLFVNSDRSLTYGVYEWGVQDELRAIGAELMDTYPGKYTVTVSLPDELGNSDTNAAKTQLGKMDAISIPLAFIILALRLGSVGVMVIPVVVLLASLLSSVALLGATSSAVSYPSFSPALFVSLTVALSFDWSLFLLSRYREAVTAKPRDGFQAAVQDMLVHSGHTVTTTGISLVCVFGTMTFFPVKFLSAIGIGASITLGTCLLVNLTLTPAALLLQHHFQCCGCCKACRPARSSGDVAMVDGDTGLTGSSSPPTPGFSALDGLDGLDGPNRTKERFLSIDSDTTVTAGLRLADLKRTFWYKLAVFVEQRPLAVLVGVLLLFSPLTIFAAKFKYSIDGNQLHPWDASVVKDWRLFNSVFPGGVASPYVLLARAKPPATANVTTVINEVAARNNALVADLVKELNWEATAFSGPTWVNGVPVSGVEAVEFTQYGEYSSDPLERMGWFFSRMCYQLNQATGSLATNINTPFDPQGEHVSDFIAAARPVIDRHNDPEWVEFYLALGQTDMYDVVNEVFADFPVVLAATCGILIILMLLAFKSVATGLRLVFTTACTLSWCYGIAAIVFCTSLFDGASARLRAQDDVYWMAPILTSGLIIGLASDYDCFLTGRIREHRMTGMDDRSAVLVGFAQTGGIITTAGVIMIVAFGSLMSSSQTLLIQCGVFLAFSVFLDTFVVRTLLSPAVMHLVARLPGGNWNWWPARMPDGYCVVDRDDSSLITDHTI